MSNPWLLYKRSILVFTAGVLTCVLFRRLYKRSSSVLGAEATFDAAYRNTDYIVYEINSALRIDEHSPKFDALLRKHGADSCIFLTAWNPKSQELTRKENDRRNELLVATVKQLGDHPIYKGEGKGRTGNWPPELSYLIVGVPSEAANELADQFGQNAYVAYALGGVAKLVWRK